MGITQWDNSLSLGIELIDGQHRVWLDRLNRVAIAVANHEGPAQVVAALNFLRDYTTGHFAAEEKFMALYQYPEMAAHQARHAELQDTLRELIRDFDEEGATQGLAVALDELLGNWLRNHIMEVDAKFGAFLRANKIVLK